MKNINRLSKIFILFLGVFFSSNVYSLDCPSGYSVDGGWGVYPFGCYDFATGDIIVKVILSLHSNQREGATISRD